MAWPCNGCNGHGMGKFTRGQSCDANVAYDNDDNIDGRYGKWMDDWVLCMRLDA